MKIFYDHQVFSWQKVGGISRYFIEIMRHLPDDISYMLPSMLSENVYLPQLGEFMPEVKRWHLLDKHLRKKLYERINQRRSETILPNAGCDVLHPTYYNPYFLRRRTTPYVITVHDMIHEKFAGHFSDASSVMRDKKRVITEADAIIAISENTKRDIIDIYGLPAEKINVVYHGVTRMSAAPVPVDGVGERFLLYVGDRKRYKNFMNFAEAFVLMSKADPELRLVCTGKPLSRSERKRLDSLGITDKVTVRFVSDGELAWLYARAACFVFPSSYEGFGLPILEAWGAGAPVALSRASCFPEIAADAAAWFDPDDPSDIAHAVSEVVYSPELRSRLIKLGGERLKMFNWETTARLTADIYRSLSGK